MFVHINYSIVQSFKHFDFIITIKVTTFRLLLEFCFLYYTVQRICENDKVKEKINACFAVKQIQFSVLSSPLHTKYKKFGIEQRHEKAKIDFLYVSFFFISLLFPFLYIPILLFFFYCKIPYDFSKFYYSYIENLDDIIQVLSFQIVHCTNCMKYQY